MAATYGPEALNFASVGLIEQTLATLTTKHVSDPQAFERQVRRFATEQVQPPFAGWGHDHDFGTFRLAGTMGTRHIWMLSRLFDHFGVSVEHDVRGRRVLDIGTWSGAVSLILARLGADVTSIDTGAAYIDALTYLAEAFELPVRARVQSIHEIDDDGYDTIFCLGVLYHLADPVAALARCYAALRPGGLLCVESYVLDTDERVAEYFGPSVGRPNVGYRPSPSTLRCWIADAGYQDIQVGNGLVPMSVTSDRDPMGAERAFAVARR